MSPGVCQEGSEEIPNRRVLTFDGVVWALESEEKECVSIRKNSLEKSLVWGGREGLCEALGVAGKAQGEAGRGGL